MNDDFTITELGLALILVGVGFWIIDALAYRSQRRADRRRKR